MNPRIAPAPGALIALAALSCAVLFSGCAVSFVAPYDETTDRLLTELSQKTETAAVRADAGQLSAEEREKFYSESLGTVRTLQVRAELFVKNEGEIFSLGELKKLFERLQKRDAQPLTSVTTGLRGSLKDLQQIELAKKRSSAFSAGLKKSSSSP
jgi:hypothetical protein